MLDIKNIVDNPDYYYGKLKEKGCDIDVHQLVNRYQQYLSKLQELQNLRTAKNDLTKKIKIIDKKTDEFINLKDQVVDINLKINETVHQENELYAVYMNEFLRLPNILDDDVPLGKDENDNKVLNFFGKVPHFDFNPKDHIELTANIKNGLNFKKGAELAKSRFTVMNGHIAQLHRALGQFMIDCHIDNGYLEYNVPVIVKDDILKGTGQLPKFEEDLFKVQGAECGDDKLYLIPTAEVPLTNVIRDERVTEDDLPIKMTALTQCFRSEAGSYGRDTKGMIRQHQFEKVEMVQIVDPNKSEEALEEIVTGAERILQLLDLPYRKVLLCSGDTGFSAKKTYDLEVWIPSQDTYREISSCSNMGDFQARRIGSKVIMNNKEKVFPHTLNGSGLAVGRTLIAVLENYQNEDGSITIPDVLIPYMRGLNKIY